MITWKLLSWCITRRIFLRASHLSGKENTIADALSRGRAIPTEWPLHRPTVQQIFNVLDTPHIDLFASHLNNQLPTFCSRHVNPSGLGNRRIEHQQEGDPGLCIPSNLSAPPCPREDRSRDMQNTSDRPFLAKTGLVSSTPGSPSPSTSGLAKAPRSPDTTNLQGSSSRSRQSDPDRPF